MTSIVARSTSSLSNLNPFVVATVVSDGETLVALSKSVGQARAALLELWTQHTCAEFPAYEIRYAILDTNQAVVAYV